MAEENPNKILTAAEAAEYTISEHKGEDDLDDTYDFEAFAMSHINTNITEQVDALTEEFLKPVDPRTVMIGALASRDEPVYLSVEIFKTGPFLQKNEVVSIGYFIGTHKGGMIEKNRINFYTCWPVYQSVSKTFNIFDFDPAVWDKAKDFDLSKLKENPLDQQIGWSVFIQALTEIEYKYRGNITLLTSNMLGVLPSIDLNLERYAQRCSITASSFGVKPLICPYDRLAQTPPSIRKEIMQTAESLCSPSVDPQSEAEMTYWIQVLLTNRPS